jgi:hypothetical protein
VRSTPPEVSQAGVAMTSTEAESRTNDRVREIGKWSARAMVVIELAYVVVFVVGFASIGNTSDPLPDPYLAIAQVIIIVMAPILVMLMMAIHQCAPAHAKPFTLIAFGWMVALAAFTITANSVQLMVARHIDPATFPGYERIFDYDWPSTFYAIDIVAWDVFFALSLLFAVPAFARSSDGIVRKGLILSGSMCLVGLIGPFVNALGWRTIGIFGYTIVFGVVCIPLSRTFRDRTPRATGR